MNFFLFLFIHLYNQVWTCSGLVGPRNGVVKYGYTVPYSGWALIKSALKSTKCPAGTVAFNNGTLCCANFLKQLTPGCPNNSRYLLYSDPPQCCLAANTTACSNPKTKCSTPNVGSVCPSTFPFLFNYGASCCANLWRSPTCPAGTNSTLQKTDPMECCFLNMSTSCLTPSGSLGLCMPYSCFNTVTINSSDPTYSTATPGLSALTDECETSALDLAQTWQAPNSVANAGFVVDVGCPRTIASFSLRNSHNFQWNDRGTKGFTIEVSADLLTWKTAVNATLANVNNLYCDPTNVTANPIPLVTFPTSQVHVRFIRFRATSYYSCGAALQYITWTAY